MKEYLKSFHEVLEEKESRESGLSNLEAEKRLAKYGKNKLVEGKKETLLERFFKQLADPMIIILIAAAIISGITSAYSGESFADVIIIMTVVIINAVLGVVQESKAEAAIAALREIAAATSKVIRGGHITVIKSEDVAIGDIILLEAGDSIPADARIIESASMKAEEAALTGESVPVSKTSDTISSEDGKDVPLGDRKNMVYMGSTIVYGRGKAVVTGIGMDTEMGKIADELSKAEEGQTPLQIKLSQLSKILSVLVIGICAIIFLIDIIKMYPDVSAAGLLDTFMVAVSLAVAAIPEGLAAVVTIVLSIGVTNMSKKKAVIRRLTAVETLGCTQVICSDKTGTLTQNKMTVVKTNTQAEEMLQTAMALCNDAELEGKEATGEPTESALVNYAARNGLSKNDLKLKYKRIGEAPFDSMRKMMSTVHKKEDGSIIQFTKGAPDEVLKKCTHILTENGEIPLEKDVLEGILAENKSMADFSLRVLCGALRKWNSPPKSFEADYIENSLCYIGLMGMIDPVRPEVIDAIDECRSAGIRPIMITGDHKDTAIAIAKELKIISNPDEAITGAMLNDMTDKELLDRIESYSVYARVQPEHKVRIVKAWRKKGKITAMTGDGVNDAPSIKNADIGIGMGITGTDVTKNVADMVLADDNFATIVSAVEEGRRIYDNIRKSIQFLLSSNLSEVLSIFAATLMGFIILKPAHLLWINLITDSFPALALGMENAEDNIMKRAPRAATDGVFSGGMGFDVAFQGFAVTLITLAAYFIGHYIEAGKWEIVNSPDGMTMAFLALSMAEIFHSFNMRSRRMSVFTLKKQNMFLWGAMGLSLILTTGVIFVPFLSNAFGFEPISALEYFVAMGLAFTIMPIVEIQKAFERKFEKNKDIY
ncbi:MAG: cation-translocating P-type ATPase [Lachnospiraceae bacterium]|nr:cation-translocating P-type ATPase [Lachnospiraceae bacterium]